MIRSYRPGDAAGMAEVFYRAVREVGSRDYSADQVEAWAPAVPDPDLFAARAEDGRTTLVAADAQDRPRAFADLEANGHIDLLYCHPDDVGTGIAAELVDRLEAIARAQGLGRLFVEASEAARRLFLRKGFRQVERRAFELRGVTIHNYGMDKTLD